jgi:hypothetical protein
MNGACLRKGHEVTLLSMSIMSSGIDYTDYTDEDNNTLATIIPCVEILGPIT